MGEPLPYMISPVEFMLSIPNVICFVENGTKLFLVLPSERTQHIFEMVLNQKPPKEKTSLKKTRGFFGSNKTINEDKNYYKTNIRSQYSNNFNKGNYNNQQNHHNQIISKFSSNSNLSEGFYESRENCYEDNYRYLQSRFQGDPQPNRRPTSSVSEGYYQSTSSLNSSSESSRRRAAEKLEYQKQNGYLLSGFQFCGDDFFLYSAKMELDCKFVPGKKVLQSGLCVSGQTISDARLRVSTCETVAPYLIINIGSVDIMNGKPLVRMESDAIGLTEAVIARNSVPIWTSLAPLANYNHQPEIATKVKKFNEFLERRMNNFIDISKVMKQQNGKTLYDCYQP